MENASMRLALLFNPHICIQQFQQSLRVAKALLTDPQATTFKSFL